MAHAESTQARTDDQRRRLTEERRRIERDGERRRSPDKPGPGQERPDDREVEEDAVRDARHRIEQDDDRER